MTARFRPVHSSFETLRQAGNARRASVFAFGSAANEQLTAASYARVVRPCPLHAEALVR
ncbi:hypothetical protein SAMN05880582_10734 [Rhizobium sp. RU20A]|uniref:hypothetical protein n=1 Tax=Rhizobium sp. RU20A TaxID=1907412 RepID=UPI000955E685|nr:hypothetical protein [Rhizobium sp. RU20A]SIR15135.1 hypothetical protein SAMN05880582_10734 [Rhizobium sp. RU20A]